MPERKPERRPVLDPSVADLLSNMEQRQSDAQLPRRGDKASGLRNAYKRLDAEKPVHRRVPESVAWVEAAWSIRKTRIVMRPLLATIKWSPARNEQEK